MQAKSLLALDISSTNIGWCLYADGSPKAHGTLKLKGDLHQRIALTEPLIEDLVRRLKPDRVAIEAPAYSRNTATVAQQRCCGVVLLVLGRHKLATVEIAPNTAKKALSGSGRADKKAMIAAARDYLDGQFDEHAADALAVALAAVEEL